MAKSPIARILALASEENFPFESPEKSVQQLTLPTMDERVNFYLRAVHGAREFGNQEYSEARDLLLNRMAADLAEESPGLAAQNVRFPPASKDSTSSPEARDAYRLELSLKDSRVKMSAHCAPPPNFRSVSSLTEFPEQLPRRLSEPSLLRGIAPQLDDVALAQSRARFPAPAYQRARRSVFIWAAGATVVASAFVIMMLVPVPWLVHPTSPQSSASGPFEIKAEFASPKQVEATAAQRGSTSAELAPGISPNKIEKTEAANIIRIGRELVVVGDIPRARLLFRPLAEAGDASAALELGATYDPVVLGELREKTVTPDLSIARAWYMTAQELGSTEASTRLERLSNLR
jgi:TPR repeat protein